jgi:hypothetical protein
MPPQQPDRPLDVFDDVFDFGAHDGFPFEARFSDWGPFPQVVWQFALSG